MSAPFTVHLGEQIRGARAVWTFNVLSGLEDLNEGYTQVMTVEGVDGIGVIPGVSGGALAKFFEAMTRVDSGGRQIPQLGTVAGPLMLARIVTTGASTDTIDLELTWVRIGYIKSEIRNFLTTKETNKGSTNLVGPGEETFVLQTVSYNAASPPPDSPNPQTQSGLVPVLSPEATWTAWRRESEDPKDKTTAWVGSLNAAGWDIFPDSAEGTWLCTALDGVLDESLGLYDVTYSFHYREESWKNDAVYRNPAGQVPADIVEGTGTTSFWTAFKMQFNDLDLLSQSLDPPEPVS